MTLSNMFLWLLAALGLYGPSSRNSAEEPRGSVVVVAVPDCFRGDYTPILLTPTGNLEDCLCHRVDFGKIGQRMKTKADGRPSVVEIMVEDEEGMPGATLAEAVRKLREVRAGWFDDMCYGPPNAIVFLYMRKLDPVAWWYRYLSTFPGPLSRLPKLGPDGRRIVNGQIILPGASGCLHNTRPMPLDAPVTTAT